MAKYFSYDGLIFEYPMSDDRTGFIIQSVKYDNFNDSPLIANAAYFATAPIWGHAELHITRVATIHEANAANSRVLQYVATGNDPSRYIVVPAGFGGLTLAGETVITDSGEVDIPIEPTGAVNTTSRLAFIIIGIADYHASDDLTLVFQGWHRGWYGKRLERV